MAQHAILSPSGSERWMGCLGSPAMEHGRPDTSSEYADEGTAAHFLGAHCLETNTWPIDHAGKKIIVYSHPESNSEGVSFYDLEENLIEVDVRGTYPVDDMIEPVTRYVELVRGYHTGGELFVEVELPIGQYTLEEDATGTSDAVVLHKDTLTVIDLKYGRGNEVSAEHNKQLMLYALGALDMFDDLSGPFTKVRLVICQPRISYQPSEWEVSLKDLMKFAGEVRSTAVRVWRIYDAHLAGEPVDLELKAGALQCKYCKAKTECPEADRYITEALGSEFTDLTTQDRVKQDAIVNAKVQAAADLNLLGAKMDAVELIESWCKAIRAEVERRLLKAIRVPNYKLVEGKRGNREWEDEAAVEEEMRKMRIKADVMYKRKLISPTQAESTFKSNPKRWAKIKQHIIQREGKPSVTHVSDKRPEYLVAPIESEFQPIIDDGEDLV